MVSECRVQSKSSLAGHLLFPSEHSHEVGWELSVLSDEETKSLEPPKVPSLVVTRLSSCDITTLSIRLLPVTLKKTTFVEIQWYTESCS